MRLKRSSSTAATRSPSLTRAAARSEEHTSELQSQSNLVCRLLLEKKKHMSELQPQTNLACRLLLENANAPIAQVVQQAEAVVVLILAHDVADTFADLYVAPCPQLV